MGSDRRRDGVTRPQGLTSTRELSLHAASYHSIHVDAMQQAPVEVVVAVRELESSSKQLTSTSCVRIIAGMQRALTNGIHASTAQSTKSRASSPRGTTVGVYHYITV